jgi:quercetin dioxygenase-like cupin family protein
VVKRQTGEQMTATHRVIRLSEDAAGESHFDDFEVILALTDFAPPAPSFLVSAVADAAGYVLVTLPVGWVGELHPSPHRQILFCLSGALKVTASDGASRVIDTGSAWLMTDTEGKGHQSEVVSDKSFEAVIILTKKYLN